MGIEALAVGMLLVGDDAESGGSGVNGGALAKLAGGLATVLRPNMLIGGRTARGGAGGVAARQPDDRPHAR